MTTGNEQPTSSSPPSLPPLYFADMDEENSNPSFAIEPLPSEVLCNITSFLDWGDYARLSVTNSSFKSIMHDAATLSDQKWDLAMALLNGTNGLEQNPKLAIKYLHDLAGVQVTKETFDAKYEPMVESEDGENESIVSIKKNHSTIAMKKLAGCYLEGNGVQKNRTLGMAWLKSAHCHGDIEAAYETATIYEYRKYGVEVDIYNAAEWFLGAANAGHLESMAEYAMCLELGCGVEQSDDQALDWYTKAAEMGHAVSSFSVGEMFEEARGGLPQSDTEAVLWYYKAAMMGDEDSKKALYRLNEIARIVIPGWAATLNEQARGTRS
jgi:TPR repeat protein